ncbi:MAG TPA: hypothetical protein VIJ07_15705 [Dermatophilaceae bacterium]|jgi:hypothetical protein
MSNSQNPDQGEPTTGWVRPSKRPSRGKYLLAGLIGLALVVSVGVFVVARAKSVAATRRHQASAQWTSWSAISHASITEAHGSNAGRDLATYFLAGGGKADANVCPHRPSRTLCRRASSRIDMACVCRSSRIASNSSSRCTHLTNLHVDDTDVKI